MPGRQDIATSTGRIGATNEIDIVDMATDEPLTADRHENRRMVQPVPYPKTVTTSLFWGTECDVDRRCDVKVKISIKGHVQQNVDTVEDR